MTRCYEVPLKAEACLRHLDTIVNHEKADAFRMPNIPFTSRQYGITINAKKIRFQLGPAGMFPIARVGFEGYLLESSEDKSRFYIRLMPPVWFFYFFIWVPILFLFPQMSFDEKWILLFFWGSFGNLWLFIHIWVAGKLFTGLDTVFLQLGSVRTECPKITCSIFLKKAVFYLFIAVVYIGILFFMVFFMQR